MDLDSERVVVSDLIGELEMLQHIKRFCEATTACEAGWWFKFDRVA